MDKKRLAEGVLRARNRAGLSQYDLADRARVSRGTIAAIETGAHATSRIDTIERIAEATGATIDEIIGGVPDETPPALKEFLSSSFAKDVTPEEICELRRVRACGKRPTPATYYLALPMLRSMEE